MRGFRIGLWSTSGTTKVVSLETNKSPICTIVAGPNGAGKTTFALRYLPKVDNFINADEIAKQIEKSHGKDISAARLFFHKFEEFKARRESFAIESTLSGGSHLKRISKLLSDGWQVKLYYLWVSSVDDSINRVANRVKVGGHNIPNNIIKRRYPRSIYNFIFRYKPLCSYVVCIDNEDDNQTIIFEQYESGKELVQQKKAYDLLKRVAKDEKARREYSE